MYTLQNLIRTKGEGADGMYNLGNYSNKDLDVIIDRIKTETDAAKRDADIITVLEGHAKDFGHIPLHDQVIPWAMRKNVTVVHRADNRLVADWVQVD
jgi:peptide/nickel transport system substrate-binding protein